MVREVWEVEREAEVVAARVVAEAEALRRDASGRVAVGRSTCGCCCGSTPCAASGSTGGVTKRVLALQDSVDALEPKLAPTTVMDENAVADAMVDGTVEMPEAEVAEEREINGKRDRHVGSASTSSVNIQSMYATSSNFVSYETSDRI